jgi:hypothetical protein
VTTVFPSRALSIVLAQASLDDACRDLDDAVRELSEDGSDTVMANADLVARLLCVVSARHHLKDVERETLKQPPPSIQLPGLGPTASLR